MAKSVGLPARLAWLCRLTLRAAPPRAMPEHEEALVLKTEPSGESFIKLYVLSVESGIFLCMKRVSKKANSSTIPDLFDTAVILLETSQQGTMRFVKEYQLRQRRDVIGQNYRSLRSASVRYFY